jgi:hypothetical protein
LLLYYSKPNNNSTFQDSRKNELFVDIIEKLTGVINADVRNTLQTRGSVG